MNWTDKISNQKTEINIVSDCGFCSHLKSLSLRGRCEVVGSFLATRGQRMVLKGTKAWSIQKNTVLAGERVKVKARKKGKTRKERLEKKRQKKRHWTKERGQREARGAEKVKERKMRKRSRGRTGVTRYSFMNQSSSFHFKPGPKQTCIWDAFPQVSPYWLWL